MLSVLQNLGLPFGIWPLRLDGMWTIVSYVLTAVSLYSIAKRRGIPNPGLAWIPVGRIWILGCISDQYHYVVSGTVKNKRKTLLVLNILLILLAVAMCIMLAPAITYLGLNAKGGFDYVGIFASLTSMGGAAALILLLPGMSIAAMVIGFMALYDVFASCEPANKPVYLLLSIFFGFTTPIFLLVCKNKDLGMPPRRDAFRQTAQIWEHRG